MPTMRGLPPRRPTRRSDRVTRSGRCTVGLPASWCGLAGLKTTIGRVSTYGILPLAPSLDTPGPLARSVEDAALLYSVMHGKDPLDPRTLAAPPADDPMAGLKRGVRGL